MPGDWLMGLAGGLMIGCAGAAYLLGIGRIMGASGIVGGVVDGTARGTARLERLAFLAGLILTPALFVGTGAGRASAPVAGTAALIVAGLLVGVGTRLANGCTSGHGVCGISRLSLRGIVATLVYIGVGILTVTLARWLGGA
ncbi:MAG TPA: YeeE/YedE thiosulfate transporter family protein [Paracoccus sp. (in: a-proteobacteria)]|nr:YeeE/YedE thiosulfate transporter family protein [Paracoccus sp. (in: a-proteobacteria)]